MTEMVISRVFTLEKRSREIENTSLIRAGFFFFLAVSHKVCGILVQ